MILLIEIHKKIRIQRYFFKVTENGVLHIEENVDKKEVKYVNEKKKLKKDDQNLDFQNVKKRNTYNRRYDVNFRGHRKWGVL